MVKRRRKKNVSAAERRIRALAPDAPTLTEAVREVIRELLKDVNCPPTDLADVAGKIGVREISYESFPGSGELHKIPDGYRIVCSTDQPRVRQRFTIAHELAHVLLERTGRNAPRAGEAVERVCDMLAAECLMPTSVFETRLSRRPRLDDVVELARIFETSITATAIRCAQLRPVCMFGVAGDRVIWGYEGIRPGAVKYLLDEVRDAVQAALAGQRPAAWVYFYADGYGEGYRRFEWIRSGADSAVFMLGRAANGSAGVGTDHRSWRPSRS